MQNDGGGRAKRGLDPLIFALDFFYRIVKSLFPSHQQAQKQDNVINREGALEKQGKQIEEFFSGAGTRMLVVVIGELGENETLGHERPGKESNQAGTGVEDVDDENDGPEVHSFNSFLAFGRNPFLYIDSIAQKGRFVKYFFQIFKRNFARGPKASP